MSGGVKLFRTGKNDLFYLPWNGLLSKSMRLSVSGAWCLLVAQALLLLIGTLMPGMWRNNTVAALGAPGVISPVAHYVLFCGMAGVASISPLRWPLSRVILLGLGLALLSEGLQFLAIDRHPRWLDVGIDMAGVLTAIVIVRYARSPHGLT